MSSPVKFRLVQSEKTGNWSVQRYIYNECNNFGAWCTEIWERGWVEAYNYKKRAEEAYKMFEGLNK